MFTKDANKYCVPRENNHTITLKFEKPIWIDGYGYMTAEDCFSRDPGNFSLVTPTKLSTNRDK